jgi:hypothetical protein
LSNFWRDQKLPSSKGIQATGQLDQQTLKELGLDADEFRQQSQSEKKTDANPSNW